MSDPTHIAAHPLAPEAGHDSSRPYHAGNVGVQFVAPDVADEAGRDEARPYDAENVGAQFIAPNAAPNDVAHGDSYPPSIPPGGGEGRLSPQRVIAVVLLIALIFGVFYFYLFTASGDSAADTIVAIANGELIRQSDVDVQINLDKAINETMGQTSNISADDVLSSLVFEHLALQDIRKHNYPLVSETAVEKYLDSVSSVSHVNAASFGPALTKYGVARSVLSDSLRTNLTIENYKNEKIASTDLTPDQRDLLLNNWRSSLYDARTAQISYPNKLRDDNGPAAKAGHLAPEVAGSDLHSGKPVALSQLKGHPVLINFWATWCGPCRAEMPELVDAYNKFKGSKGLVVLAVDTEDSSVKDKVISYISQFKMSFPVIMDGDDNHLVLAYHIQATPSSFFIDTNGKVQYVQIGAMDAATLQSNLSKILP